MYLEATYQRKPNQTKALQYDGTEQHAEYLAGEYKNLLIQGSTLFFMVEDYGDDYEEVYKDDWLLITGITVTDHIDRDIFESLYEEIKPWEKK
jgi:hypothetical protein